MPNSRIYLSDEVSDFLTKESVLTYLVPEIRLTKNPEECRAFAAFYSPYEKLGPAGLLTVWSEHHRIQEEVELFQEVFDTFDPEMVRDVVVSRMAGALGTIVLHLNILCKIGRYSENTTRDCSLVRL